MKFLKYCLVFGGFLLIFAVIYYAFSSYTGSSVVDKAKSGIVTMPKTPQKPKEKSDSAYEQNDIISVALLGIDRRSRAEAFRTDIMIIVALNKKTNQVVMVSVPRDLWWKDGRINAAYIQGGWPSLQEAGRPVWFR